MDATIRSVLEDLAARFGDKPALVDADERATSFAALSERVGRFAAALRRRGLADGDRVAILARNRPAYVEAMCVSAFGLVAVPLNWRLTPPERAAVLRDCRPAAIVAEAAFADTVDQAMPDTLRIGFDGAGAGWLAYEDLLSEAEAPGAAAHRPRPEATACLVYTSGTTGTPKGAALSHRGLVLNGRSAIADLLQLFDRDVTLAVMPFFHVGGFWFHLFPSVMAGCTTHVRPGFEAAATLAAIRRHGVTNVHLVPTMIHALLAETGPEAAGFDALRLIYYAASSIPVTLLRRALATFSGCGFVQGYGSTEAGMLACLTRADHRAVLDQPDRLESCGRALPGVTLALAEVADGVGEIVVRSPMTMTGYWERPDDTARAMAGGWLRTGDLGRLDVDGYLTIIDRKSDMIVTGGENVYPREVEEAMLADPDVADVCVFDLPDERWVQRVVAAVVGRPGADGPAILGRLRTRLASYKCPKRIVFVDGLPRNGAGKVLRRELRALFNDQARDDGVQSTA